MFFLFRGGLPIIYCEYWLYGLFFTHYSFLKNKFFFMWTYHDWPYNFCKFLGLTGSWITATAGAYPFLYAREMVDVWPKERGGHCTFKNNYLEALKFVLESLPYTWQSFFSGYWHFMWRKGLPLYIALWSADNSGMFSNGSEAWHSLEHIFPTFVEAL